MAASIGVFFLVQAVCAIAIGITESFMARFRMNHNPEFIFSVAAAALVLVFSIMQFR